MKAENDHLSIIEKAIQDYFLNRKSLQDTYDTAQNALSNISKDRGRELGWQLGQIEIINAFAIDLRRAITEDELQNIRERLNCALDEIERLRRSSNVVGSSSI